MKKRFLVKCEPDELVEMEMLCGLSDGWVGCDDVHACMID